jgi:peptidyl-prolyl cis-trans isomerase SurA
VAVTSEDVDQFVERIAREREATTDQLYQAIEREGITRTEYRAHMETEVRRLKVLQLRVRGRINITESDLQEGYRRLLRENAGAAVIRAAHIFLAIPADATDEATDAIAVRAAEVARRARAGEDFATLATQYSEDEATRTTGGDLGEVQTGTVPESIERALTTLQDGQTSEVVRGPNGFHIVRATSRRAVTPPPFADVRDRLYAALLNREMFRQQEIYLRELRRNASVDMRWDTATPAPAVVSTPAR